MRTAIDLPDEHLPSGAFYGTFIEHWPAALAALSMPHSGIVMAESDARLMAGCAEHRVVTSGMFSAPLVSWVEQVVQRWDEGAFFRLGGRSFVVPGRPPVPIRRVDTALQLLSMPGDRAARMAARCVLAGRPLWLFARQWRAMAYHEEFRLVVRNRRVTAASQLHHQQCFAELPAVASEVARRIVAFSARLGEALHLNDVVADVWMPVRADTRDELVELNPLMSITGKALLDTAVTGEHRAALHFRRPDGAVGHAPLPMAPDDQFNVHKSAA